jgi:hypothetical protein
MKYLLIGLLLGAAFSAAHAQSTYDSNRAQELLNEQIQQQQRIQLCCGREWQQK